jgi:type II secretory pathway pseudopilin PulG
LKHITRGRGFTLVEMLIVLAIIICLMGLFLPALTRAREQVHRAQCVSNLHQLTVAWLTYASDNERRFCSPDGNPLAKGNGPPWIGQARGSLGVHAGVLWPYLNNEAVYCCPDDASLNNNKTSYQMNGFLRAKKLDDLSKAPQTFVFIEGCDHNVIFSTTYFSGFPGENHHGMSRFADGTGISFADGHAIFWEYVDPRTGNLLELSWGGVAGGPRISPDMVQLGAWSGQ